jgi:hypothetical protein
VLWGVHTPLVPGPGHWHGHVKSVENKVGRRFDIVRIYESWDAHVHFPDGPDRHLAAGGKRILEFAWDATRYRTGTPVSYRDIVRGRYDKTVIRREAKRLKSFHHKVFLDFNHEFDAPSQADNGSATEYAKAYRHIYRQFRKDGVHNVIWVWVSTGYLGVEKTIKAGFPGARYVDWVGYDPYNFASCDGTSWRSPYQVFTSYYHWVRHQPGMRHKPMMLAEYATLLGTRAHRWYDDVPHALRRLPRIKAVIEWNQKDTNGCDFAVTDSASALAGFRAASHSPYVLGTGR